MTKIKYRPRVLISLNGNLAVAETEAEWQLYSICGCLDLGEL